MKVTVEELTAERLSVLETSAAELLILRRAQAFVRQQEERSGCCHYRHFLVRWDGPNVPRGIRILCREVIRIKDGIVIANPGGQIGVYHWVDVSLEEYAIVVHVYPEYCS